MQRIAVEPSDIAVCADDPFDGLEPGGADAPWRSFSLDAPRLFCTKVFRTTPASTSEAAALRLGAWLAEGRYAGLIMDYRGARIHADPAASKVLADASAAAFPRGVLVGYLGDGPGAPFTRLMTTLLRDRGVRAARARDFDTLYAAMMRTLNSPGE